MKVRSNGMEVRSNGRKVRSNGTRIRSNGMQVAIRLHFCPECPSIVPHRHLSSIIFDSNPLVKSTRGEPRFESKFPRDGKRFHFGLTIMCLNKHYELLFFEENRHTSLVQTLLKKINYFSYFPSLPFRNFRKICNN